MRYLIPLGLFGVLTVFLYIGLGLNPRELQSTLLDKPAPVFNLPQVNDPKQVLKKEDLLGKVSLINVWASWCVSCRQEHPLLMQLSKQKDIHLYGLNWKDELIAAKDWLVQHGDPYKTSAFDPTGRTGIDYGVTGTPETFVLDKEGIVRYKHIGPITKEVFIKILFPLMQQLEKQSTTSKNS
jgi:cytochrome c biogenesis protein CcmG, thiol:disulfide interchange protein DsbE